MNQPKSNHNRPESETPCSGVFQWQLHHQGKKETAMRECPECGLRQFGSRGVWCNFRDFNKTPGTDMLGWSPR